MFTTVNKFAGILQYYYHFGNLFIYNIIQRETLMLDIRKPLAMSTATRLSIFYDHPTLLEFCSFGEVRLK